jgi:hypothetical protein
VAEVAQPPPGEVPGEDRAGHRDQHQNHWH